MKSNDDNQEWRELGRNVWEWGEVQIEGSGSEGVAVDMVEYDMSNDTAEGGDWAGMFVELFKSWLTVLLVVVLVVVLLVVVLLSLEEVLLLSLSFSFILVSMSWFELLFELLSWALSVFSCPGVTDSSAEFF